MPKSKSTVLLEDLPQLRDLDLNVVFEELDELDVAIDAVNERLILDGAFGYQYAAEGILNEARFYDITEDEYEACDAGQRAAMRAVNAVMQRMNLDYEIVEVDLADTMGFMLVAKGATAEQVAKNIKKGRI
jgi:hypothetical protein